MSKVINTKPYNYYDYEKLLQS